MSLDLERRDLLAGLLAGLAPAGALAAPATASSDVTVRLVVTGHNAQGRSVILSDRRVGTGALWAAVAEQPMGAPAPDEKILPATAHIAPPRHGLSVNLAPILPWSDMQKRFAEGSIEGHDKNGFHRTSSIDIVIALDDGLELLVEEGSALLQAGDVVIQRNTLHGWRNRSDKPVRLLGIMAGL